MNQTVCGWDNPQLQGMQSGSTRQHNSYVLRWCFFLLTHTVFWYNLAYHVWQPVVLLWLWSQTWMGDNAPLGNPQSPMVCTKESRPSCQRQIEARNCRNPVCNLREKKNVETWHINITYNKASKEGGLNVEFYTIWWCPNGDFNTQSTSIFQTKRLSDLAPNPALKRIDWNYVYKPIKEKTLKRHTWKKLNRSKKNIDHHAFLKKLCGHQMCIRKRKTELFEIWERRRRKESKWLASKSFPYFL
jgi:hypothetical protein